MGSEMCIRDSSVPMQHSGWSLVVRPERLLVLDKASSPSQPLINGSAFDGIVFGGTIREFVFQGESAFLIVALAADASEFGASAIDTAGTDTSDSNTSVSDIAGIEVAVRFSTGTAANIDSLANGQKIELGLHRQDVIVIPKEADQ